jgi:hypothetical protein
MKNKLTVVQWLEMQLKKGIEYNALDPLSYQKSVDNLFEQALTIEKQQIMEAHLSGQNSAEEIDGETEIQYYNETYGQ